MIPSSICKLSIPRKEGARQENLSADVCRESLSLLVCSRATVGVRTHSLRMLPLLEACRRQGGYYVVSPAAPQGRRREMSNCRGTYAFLTYLVAFSKVAAPRRKKRQVVSLLLRRESLSLYHEQEYMCSCVQWSGGC